MLQMRRWLHPGSLAVGLVAGVVAAFALSASIRPAVAATSETDSTTVITYSAGLLNKVIPTKTTEKVEEVIPFPTQPVFLVRTATTVTVWERRKGALITLVDVALDSEFKSAEFLDDNKTFIIHTKKSASVYTLDRIVTVTSTTKKK